MLMEVWNFQNAHLQAVGQDSGCCYCNPCGYCKPCSPKATSCALMSKGSKEKAVPDMTMTVMVMVMVMMMMGNRRKRRIRRRRRRRRSTVPSKLTSFLGALEKGTGKKEALLRLHLVHPSLIISTPNILRPSLGTGFKSKDVIIYYVPRILNRQLGSLLRLGHFIFIYNSPG